MATSRTASPRTARAVAKRIVAHKNPELDFTAPLESADAAAERAADLADLAACFAHIPDSTAGVDTRGYAPAARFTYAKTSELALQLSKAAAQVLALNNEHKKFVKYDKERPDVYADKCSTTWEVPFLVQRELNEDSAEARFVAIEIFSKSHWHLNFAVHPMTDAGCEAVRDYVIAFAKRLAVFLKSDEDDLFELLH